MRTEGWSIAPDDRQTRIETIGGLVVQDFGRVTEGDIFSCRVTVSSAGADIIDQYALNRQFVTVRDTSGKEIHNLRPVVKKYGYVDRFEKKYHWVELEFWRV